MRFLYKKYQAKKKEIIQVSIDTTTKVKFLTAHDFKLYQKGKTHRYYGGTFEPGDVKFVCPFDSVWHAVVERGSYRSPIDITAKCTLLPPDRNTLSSIAIDAPASVVNSINQIDNGNGSDSNEFELPDQAEREVLEDGSDSEEN
jgi:hypothetical protein